MGRDRNEQLDIEWSKTLKRFARALTELTEQMEDERSDTMRIKEVRIQGPAHTGGGFRAIVKVEDEQRVPYVAFRTGSTVEDVVRQVADTYGDGTLILRPDKPWTPPEPVQTPRKSRKAGGAP